MVLKNKKSIGGCNSVKIQVDENIKHSLRKCKHMHTQSE